MNNAVESTPQKTKFEKKGKALVSFLEHCPTKTKLHQAIKALVIKTNANSLDKQSRETLLIWQEFLEEQNL